MYEINNSLNNWQSTIIQEGKNGQSYRVDIKLSKHKMKERECAKNQRKSHNLKNKLFFRQKQFNILTFAIHVGLELIHFLNESRGCLSPIY